MRDFERFPMEEIRLPQLSIGISYEKKSEKKRNFSTNGIKKFVPTPQQYWPI